MSKERELFERAISEAYERQSSSSSRSLERMRHEIVTRGRRRRFVRSVGVVGLFSVVVVGATISVGAFTPRPDRQQVTDAPVIGAERIMEFGGPLSGTSDQLFVANGRLSNDAGDRSSVAVLDVDTGDVTDTDPIAATSPLNLASGSAGLWLVAWTGDMPVGGEGNPVKGSIQLMDPASGELLLDVPRQDSAPYDVAVSENGGHESAWVADAAREQVLRVDPASGDIETIELESRPIAVVVGSGALWIASNKENSGGGVLYRYDLEESSLETFPVEHCLNDLVVMGDLVWATDYCNGKLHGVNLETGVEEANVSVGGNPSAIVGADGLLWVSRGKDIVRIDPSSAEMIGDPIIAGRDPSYLAVAGGTVFASSSDGVYRLGEGLPVQEPHVEPTPEETSDAAASESCDLSNVMCIPLDREWTVAGAGFGSAWVGNVGEGKTFGIARFDAVTGDEIARLHTDGFVQEFAPTEHWMWALMESRGERTLLKIGPSSTRVAHRLELGGSGNIGEPSLATGDGYVWVSGPGGLVTRVDEASGDVTSSTYAADLPGYGVSNGPVYLAFGSGRLWLSYGTGHLGVVDPVTGELETVHEDVLGINAYELLFAADQLWAPHQTGNGKNVVSYVSNDGGDPQGEVELHEAVPGLAVFDGDSVWVVQQGFGQNEPGLLVQVDPTTHSLIGEPLEVDIAFRGGLAAGDGYVWVTGDRVLYRITPR